MASFLDKLNLRPQEQRIVVLVITVALVIVNALFVWPRFKDWNKVQAAKAKARATLQAQQEEIARSSQYQAQLNRLAGQGSFVVPTEQALDVTRTVQRQADQNGVAISRTSPVPTGAGSNTNQFFDEQVVAIDVSCLDHQLVGFLVALGSGDSMIRVRDMDLRPDPPQYRLLGKITLVASYQKKPKTTTPAAGAKPATNTVSTPKGKL